MSKCLSVKQSRLQCHVSWHTIMTVLVQSADSRYYGHIKLWSLKQKQVFPESRSSDPWLIRGCQAAFRCETQYTFTHLSALLLCPVFPSMISFLPSLGSRAAKPTSKCTCVVSQAEGSWSPTHGEEDLPMRYHLSIFWMLPTKFLTMSNDRKQCPSSQYLWYVFIPRQLSQPCAPEPAAELKKMVLLLWHCFCLCLLEAEFAAQKEQKPLSMHRMACGTHPWCCDLSLISLPVT